MNNIKDILFDLCRADGIGNVREASTLSHDILSQYCRVRYTDTLTVIGEMKGEGDYTLMLDAHIDEIGFIVTDIDNEGFLTVDKCGGIDLRTLPARRVKIHGKQDVIGVFCSTPPHLSSGEVEFDDIKKIKIDSLLGEGAKDIISIGDFVTFFDEPSALNETKVTAKALDDRAGVVCLLELARRLSGKTLPVNVVFALSDAEELGVRGAKTATFDISPDEAIALDVSFADGPDIPSTECGKLSGGAMIGVSPILDRQISNTLLSIAKENNIPCQTEVMAGRTGTNGDAISLNKTGVRTGLVSIPERNMHTAVEVVDLRDITAVCDILEQYILKGGVKNA